MSKQKKKKRRSISFLIVPDDYSEPITLKFSMRTIRIMMVIGVLLGIHIFAGAVFYYLYFQSHRENVALRAEKLRLEAENRRVQIIAKKFQSLQEFTQKLKVSLGIDVGEGIGKEGTVRAPAITSNPAEVNADYLPVNAMPRSVPEAAGGLFRRVSSVKTPYHLLYENLPTMLPVDGLITLGFHAPNVHEGTSQKLHLGIDIAAKRGSIVKAAGAGDIIFGGWTPDLGNLIIIYHGGGMFTYYAHNMRILRKSGHVKKGEPIALLGSSGETSSGPHLHFEIWRNGVPVDPKEYLFALQQPQTAAAPASGAMRVQ